MAAKNELPGRWAAGRLTRRDKTIVAGLFTLSAICFAAAWFLRRIAELEARVEEERHG